MNRLNILATLFCSVAGSLAVAAQAQSPRNPYGGWNDGDADRMADIMKAAAPLILASRPAAATAVPVTMAAGGTTLVLPPLSDALDEDDYLAYFFRHSATPLAAQFRHAYGRLEMSNNCYSFAVGSPLNHGIFATPTPGMSRGIPFDIGRLGDGAYVARMAEADGLTRLGDDAPLPAGHYRVALFIAPGQEFHWYRENPDGTWYHKLGHLAVTNRDASGALIHDPRLADRDYRGRGLRDYRQFQGFFAVPDGGIDLETAAAHRPAFKGAAGTEDNLPAAP